MRNNKPVKIWAKFFIKVAKKNNERKKLFRVASDAYERLHATNVLELNFKYLARNTSYFLKLHIFEGGRFLQCF